jgi:hypothetical protein
VTEPTIDRPRRATITAPAPTPSAESIAAAPSPASPQSKPLDVWTSTIRGAGDAGGGTDANS